MSNKHFCQGPHCHTRVTSDRFLKSRGVIRGRYAYLDMDKHDNGHYYFNNSDKYFCSQGCKIEWLSENMDHSAMKNILSTECEVLKAQRF